MSEPIRAEKILQELRTLGEEGTTLFVAKLFSSDDRVRTPAQIKYECSEAIDHLFDEGDFDALFDERPEIEVRSESAELFAVKGLNEPAKRMIQLLNLQKAASKDYKSAVKGSE